MLSESEAIRVGLIKGTPKHRAKSKAGEGGAGRSPYRCAGPSGCGQEFRSYAEAERHLKPPHGSARLEAIYGEAP